MSSQYPLPAGYPPPGATYQPPPIGFVNPPPEQVCVGQQNYTTGVGYSPPPMMDMGYSSGAGGAYSPGPMGPGASYAPAYIPGEGNNGPAALPYGNQPPPGAQASTMPVMNASVGIDDPILIAEMNAAAEVVTGIKNRDSLPAAVGQASTFPAAAAVEVAVAAVDKRPFFLVSEFNEKCVLDVRKDCPKPGTAVGLYKKKTPNAPNQLWYIGDDGFIRSKLSDLALAAEAKHKELHTATYTGDARQQWIIEGNKVVNKTYPDECLTLKKSLVRVKDDADVIASEYEGKPTQHWKRVYVD